MKKRRFVNAVLAVVLCFSVVTQAFAAVVDHDISSGELVISSENVNTDGYRVYGSTDQYTITVGDQVSTTIILDGAQIHVSGESAIEIGSADVTLELDGSSAVSTDSGADVSCTLRFHLGSGYIGRQVEIRTLVNG